jgi:putative addiction module component (TIGR02574 family)
MLCVARKVPEAAQSGAAPVRAWQASAMSSRVRMLLEQALQLSESDRAKLALRLLDSIGESPEDIERAWMEEAERRFAEIERGEVRTVSWTEVRKRVFAR